ncbi:hypothetical protein BDB01DRAFT_691375, partial [Pilobolus umbonatus]
LYSYKLKTNGLNTQFVIDCNNICVYISDSLPYCICFDGLYENTVHEVIEKYQN